MNVTAFLMGDPPPGRSALDRQKTGKSITLARGTWNSKLTPESVVLIRASTEPTAVLAQRFGITVRSMNDVRTGRSWKHV